MHLPGYGDCFGLGVDIGRLAMAMARALPIAFAMSLALPMPMASAMGTAPLMALAFEGLANSLR